MGRGGGGGDVLQLLADFDLPNLGLPDLGQSLTALLWACFIPV